MIELGVVALLVADPGIAALVANRIDALTLPLLPVFPAITYEAMTSPSETLLDGTIGSQSSKLRIKCYGLSYVDSVNVAEAVHALLDTFNGMLPNGIRAQVTERTSGHDFYLSSSKAYGKQIDFTFFY